jgi:hypothetical protein
MDNSRIHQPPAGRPSSQSGRACRRRHRRLRTCKLGVRCLLRVHRKARRGVNGCGDGVAGRVRHTFVSVPSRAAAYETAVPEFKARQGGADGHWPAGRLICVAPAVDCSGALGMGYTLATC